jgi:beta-galactosidase/evolved beta-galactosidase subunit alpha
MGCYERTLDEMMTNYPYPQENGNRSEVDWVKLENEEITLEINHKKALNFSVHRFTHEDFEKAKHMNELVPRDFIRLNIDYKQNGLGSNSCGPIQRPEHQVKLSSFDFSFTLCGVKKEGAIVYEKIK